MSASDAVAEAVAERWLARVLASYPPAARASLGESADPFRNPAGHALRESLRLIARELFGEMNRESLMEPLDTIVRLRAVQGFSPSEALAFIFDLRDAATGLPQERIDELALMAFDCYMHCREQIFELRLKELRSQVQLATRTE